MKNCKFCGNDSVLCDLQTSFCKTIRFSFRHIRSSWLTYVLLDYWGNNSADVRVARAHIFLPVVFDSLLLTLWVSLLLKCVVQILKKKCSVCLKSNVVAWLQTTKSINILLLETTYVDDCAKKGFFVFFNSFFLLKNIMIYLF